MSSALALRPGVSVGGNALQEAYRKLLALGKSGVQQLDDAVLATKAGTAAGNTARFMTGLDPNTQMMLKRGTANTLNMIPGVSKEAAMRFAASPAAKGVLRVVPGISAGLALLDVADVVAGDEGIGNKIADTLAMTAGGIGGFVMGGGPLGAIAGASGMKAGMDGLQRLTGTDNYSEKRKLEEALLALRAGGIA